MAGCKQNVGKLIEVNQKLDNKLTVYDAKNKEFE